MSRSKWKFNCIPTKHKLFRGYIRDRDLLIQKKLIGRSFYVYNGLRFFFLKIYSTNVGYKLGEFIYTRRYVKKQSYTKKKKVKK